jgi:hypothetical protein
MKTKILITGLTLLALSTLNLQLSTAFAQGSLTPPGMPAPTMKTADQIYSKLDPRTPISSAPFTINASGSYYLTTNLTVSSGNAITIATNGVTLDLNGFTISSVAGGTGTAISFSGGSFQQITDVTIVNGHICGSFGNAIETTIGPVPNNVLVSKLTVSGVGYGIDLGLGSTVVQDCTVSSVGGMGITAGVVKNSSAYGCGSTAIWGQQVADCYGYSTGGADGIDSATAQNCTGRSNSGIGIWSTVAIGCVCYSGSGIGLKATSATSCIITSGTANIVNKYNMP